MVEQWTSDPKVPGLIPHQVSLKFGEKKFYRGWILIHALLEPIGIKYHVLDTLVSTWVPAFFQNPFWRGV